MRKLEPLAKSHHRDAFDCGSEPLNLFLKQTARQHAAREGADGCPSGRAHLPDAAATELFRPAGQRRDSEGRFHGQLVRAITQLKLVCEARIHILRVRILLAWPVNAPGCYADAALREC